MNNIIEDLKKDGYSLITLDGKRWLMSHNAKTIYEVPDKTIQELVKQGKLSLQENTRSYKARLVNQELKLLVNPVYLTGDRLNLSKVNNVYEWEAGDKWLFKVEISANLAIFGFPYFKTIAIGIPREGSDIYHLDYTTSKEDIYEHIVPNGIDITKETILDAIEIIQKESELCGF